MKFGKSDFFQLSFLIVYCVVAIFAITFLVLMGTALVMFFKVEYFHFGWGDFYKSVRAGWSVGVPGGVGVWLMSKLKG